VAERVDALGAPSAAAGHWERAAWRVGSELAGPAADDVDRRARFPEEALVGMRAAGMLSALVPEELGGRGASLDQIVGAVRALAVHCASSALVLAMHSIEVFNLARHGRTGPLGDILAGVASDQLLIANANSEVGVGGDVGRSRCAVEVHDGRWRLDKQALAISYGERADVIVATARRTADANETDQVFAVGLAPSLKLEPLSEWDTTGLRGTCSRGYRLQAEGDEGTLYPVPFSVVANNGGGQARQLLLSAAWVGLAEAAAAKAHAYARAAGRRAIGTVPPSAVRVAEIAADLQQGRGTLAAACLQFSTMERAGLIEDAGLVAALRSLKVVTSELGARTATAALGVCGIEGYRRHGPYSLDRILRDAHGGLVMVGNDRHVWDNAQLLLARKQL
jgi:acyl-CoA dehydrogenase